MQPFFREINILMQCDALQLKDRFRLRNDLQFLVKHFKLLLNERKGRESARVS